MTKTQSSKMCYRTEGSIPISSPPTKSSKSPVNNSGNGCAGVDPEIELSDLGKEHPKQDPEPESLVKDEVHAEPMRAEEPKDEEDKTKKYAIYGLYGLTPLLIVIAVVILVYRTSNDRTVLVGHSQCQLDKWEYMQLDPDGTLRLRRNSTPALTVCGDSWSEKLTHLVCGELGYFGGINFTVTSDSKRSEGYCIYRVAEKDRLTFKLIESTQCSKGILRLQCQEYHCGRKANKSTMDKRYEYSEISAYTICPSLALAFSNNGAIKCTANIVSPRWVLTGYTCIKGNTKFDDKIKLKLFAGLLEFFALNEQQPTPHIEESPQIVDIKRVIPYPQNKQSMYADDVALLELATPLQLNDVIGSICLTETNSAIDPKQRCLTTGWKSDPDYTSPTQQYMTNVSAVNVHMGHCNSYNGELPDTTICVEPLISDQTTCNNDAGAPLMCYVAATGQWQLQGILSKHSNCGNRSAIYNSITPAIATWIRHTVGNGRMFEQMNVNN